MRHMPALIGRVTCKATPTWSYMPPAAIATSVWVSIARASLLPAPPDSIDIAVAALGEFRRRSEATVCAIEAAHQLRRRLV